ncbi:MAG: hypothetical protein OZ921_13120 [Sorangiineae bacterium]|nr:hypothetical protein [Polyangiaceae bacterium]MEB2323446.1 hypothetical protein [Sorangiineae bacterium]
MTTAAHHSDTEWPASAPASRRSSEPSSWVEGLLVGGGLALLFMLEVWRLAVH